MAGEALDTPSTPVLTAAMVQAYRRLFTVPVPPDTPRRHWDPAAFLQNNVDWIEQERLRSDLPGVVRRALDASRAWHGDPPVGTDQVQDPVIAQGDARVDNMLWDGVRFRLIDFEGFGVGDLAFEIADLAEHISARLRGLRDPDAVVDGFTLNPTQRERVEAYRIVLATLWLLEVLPGNRGEALNPAGSAKLQALHLLGLLGQPVARLNQRR